MYEGIKNLKLEKRGTILVITMDNPPMNSPSPDDHTELSQIFELINHDRETNVVVLTGAGEKAFSAGGDIKRMMERYENNDHAMWYYQMLEARHIVESMLRLEKPLIGRINGQAFGGGVGLMSVCDAAIGVKGAQFGLTETRLGLIPATIGPYVLARIGGTAARRYLMASRVFDAETARRIGLLADVVPASGLDTAVAAETAPYLACAPGAVADAKALIRRLTGAPDPALIAETVGLLVKRWESAEAAEGIAAFFEKRPAIWP